VIADIGGFEVEKLAISAVVSGFPMT